MRIGFVITNLAGGGAEKAILKIASGLASRGHVSDVILLENRIAHAVPPGVRLHASAQSGRTPGKGWLGRRIAAWRLARLHTRLEREMPFDLVVSTLPFADEVCMRADLPRHWCRIANTLSAEIERLSVNAPTKARRRLARYRRMYGSRSLIAVSEGVRDDLRTQFGFARARIEVLPNPFDQADLRRLAALPSTRPDFPYIIHVGRFSSQKRHDLLLDAFAGLEGSHRLVLLTDAAPALTQMIAARGLASRVAIAGFQENPYPWIAGARLLVLSSDHEGLPNVIIEALLLGVPVVSTDCPSGPREILGAAHPSCLVQPGNAAALREGMAQVLAHPPDPHRVDLDRYRDEEVISAYERIAQGTTLPLNS